MIIASKKCRNGVHLLEVLRWFIYVTTLVSSYPWRVDEFYVWLVTSSLAHKSNLVNKRIIVKKMFWKRTSMGECAEILTSMVTKAMGEVRISYFSERQPASPVPTRLGCVEKNPRWHDDHSRSDDHSKNRPLTPDPARPPKSWKNAKNCEKSRKSRFPGVSRGLPYTPSRTQILAIFRKNPGFRPGPPPNSAKWNLDPQKGLQITAFLARFLVISAPAQTLTRPYSHEADDNESGFFFSRTLSEKCKFR